MDQDDKKILRVTGFLGTFDDNVLEPNAEGDHAVYPIDGKETESCCQFVVTHPNPRGDVVGLLAVLEIPEYDKITGLWEDIYSELCNPLISLAVSGLRNETEHPTGEEFRKFLKDNIPKVSSEVSQFFKHQQDAREAYIVMLVRLKDSKGSSFPVRKEGMLLSDWLRELNSFATSVNPEVKERAMYFANLPEGLMEHVASEKVKAEMRKLAETWKKENTGVLE